MYWGDIIKYRYKVIKSGIYLRIYEYSNLLSKKSDLDKIRDKEFSDFTTAFYDSNIEQYVDNNFLNSNFKSIDEIKDELSRDYSRSSSSINRAKQNLIYLIDENITHYSKFITLTFADNISDIKHCDKCFDKFRHYFKRCFKEDLKYICVREYQRRGAIHYHLIVFNNMKFSTKKFNKCWTYGFWKMNKIDSYFNVSRYVAKYISKSFITCNLMSVLQHRNIKAYSSSHNLKKPKIEYLSTFDLELIQQLYNIQYQNSYVLNDDHNTKVNFYEINTFDFKNNS